MTNLNTFSNYIYKTFFEQQSVFSFCCYLVQENNGKIKNISSAATLFNSKSIVHFNFMLLHPFSTVYSPCYTDIIFLGDKSSPNKKNILCFFRANGTSMYDFLYNQNIFLIRGAWGPLISHKSSPNNAGLYLIFSFYVRVMSSSKKGRSQCKNNKKKK